MDIPPKSKTIGLMYHTSSKELTLLISNVQYYKRGIPVPYKQTISYSLRKFNM